MKNRIETAQKNVKHIRWRRILKSNLNNLEFENWIWQINLEKKMWTKFRPNHAVKITSMVELKVKYIWNSNVKSSMFDLSKTGCSFAKCKVTDSLHVPRHQLFSRLHMSTLYKSHATNYHTSQSETNRQNKNRSGGKCKWDGVRVVKLVKMVAGVANYFTPSIDINTSNF